ncbi:MAG: HEAT repeat domain-containing protein [Anaerolineae bacterium]
MTAREDRGGASPEFQVDKHLTLGRRPTVAEIRDYYSRPEVLNELLEGMRRWHVRFVPGYRRQSWVHTDAPEELRAMILRPLDEMEKHPHRTEYPYFRIDEARHRPAHAWDDKHLWGYDFVIEKDARIWQVCFEAMVPVMDILKHFGVHYWLKYSGHHSLHLVIPAEVFPSEVNGVPLTTCHQAVYHRLMVFLNKRADEFYNEHDRHCPPGTNMPYSVNEDTGLVNLPLRREDLASFSPWQANIYLAQIRDVWRRVPVEAYGRAQELIDEVIKPSYKQFRVYPPRAAPAATGATASTHRINPIANEGRGYIEATAAVKRHASPVRFPNSASAAAELLDRTSVKERQLGAWALMLMGEPASELALRKALHDDDPDVRWFAAEGLLRLGARLPPSELLAIAPDDMVGSVFADLAELAGPEIVPALTRWIEVHPKTMWQALPVDEALVRIGQDARTAVETLAEHPNPRVRKQAFAILDWITGTPPLDEVLALSHTHHRKHDAALMLGWFDDPAAWSRLAELLVDRNVRARRDAIKSLLWADHPEKKRLVRNMLDDPHSKVRRMAE